MKIVQTPFGALPNATAIKQEPKSIATSPAQGVALTLSGGVRALDQAAAEAHFDADKVALVKQAIDQNSYHVSAEKLADKLLFSAQEMLNRRSRLESSIVLNSAYSL